MSNDNLPVRWYCETPPAGGVYLIHFSTPFGHARHYTGWSKDDIVRRIRQHANGSGSRLCHLAVQAGSRLLVARVWPDATRQQERTIKTAGATKYCPICKATE